MGTGMSVMVLVAAAGVLSACTRPNPAYCDESVQCASGLVCNLATHACSPAPDADGTDGAMACAVNEQCTDPRMPICTQGTCVPCSLDDECSSGVCRTDGSCELVENVLYVDPNGISAGQCTSETPCELMYARSLISSQRSSIRVANGIYQLPSTFLVTPPIDSVAIVGGRSAVFERAAAGPSFDVRSGAKLSLRGITLHRGLECNAGAVEVKRAGFSSPSETRPWLLLDNCMLTVQSSELDSSMGHGIDADYGSVVNVADTTITRSAGSGIRIGSGRLDVERSSITNNMGTGVLAAAQQVVIRRSTFHTNRLGGISSVGGVFDITNNFVYRNGNDANAPFGGLRLDTTMPGNRFDHNTVIRNDAQYGATPTYAGGVYCRGGGSFANNLIANNFYGNQSQPNSQTSGTCVWTGTLVLNADDSLQFVGATMEPFDYHLASSQSPAVNAGVALNVPVTDDFDGDLRNDGAPDVGADEFRP